MSWRIECLLCGAQAGVAQEGQAMRDSPVGQHLIDVHHWTVEQVDNLTFLRLNTGAIAPAALGAYHFFQPGQPDVMLAHELSP